MEGYGGGIMNKKEFVEFMDSKLKLVRTEYGLTQDKMALVLGISKKTLVEIAIPLTLK